MAICFDCWKLVKITEVKPKKVYYNGWRRWGYESDIWRRLTTRKYNPLSEKQACGINPDIEELLRKEVNRYYKKKDRYRLKADAIVIPEGANTLSRLDGFEKQLKEREASLKQKENNIKNTIEAQVAEERKRLKDEYDALKIHLENDYNKCLVDMKQTTYSFKYQLENQHKSCSANLERQYKTRISALDKANAEKVKEIGKLSSTVLQLKNEKKDLKKSAEHKYKDLDDIIFAKDLKIITLNDQLISFNPSVGRDGIIEPSTFISFYDTEFWTEKWEEAKDNLSI
ncbi:hypothetical protein C1645_833988 [Glomus cerebriforme]|uniref:Uncharacterized protein n=1 Tax=Glomus cerebriforme TaxID=658196 RepID=A0A397SL82_9GLOM|nr:hypothetical protein C1645_833988 [Glomus cerebriforme]